MTKPPAQSDESIRCALIWVAKAQTTRYNFIIIAPRHEKMCLREFATRPDTNWPVQPQKLARVLKFRL